MAMYENRQNVFPDKPSKKRAVFLGLYCQKNLLDKPNSLIKKDISKREDKPIKEV